MIPMILLSQLNEASALPISDLKKAIAKDPRVNSVLTKGLELETIQNPIQWLATLKFFLLNNQNVMAFVENRDYIKDIDKAGLKRLRELKSSGLTQIDVDNIVQFTQDVFREHGYVDKSGMSAPLRKEILNWANTNGRFFDLPLWAQRELKSLPDIRPAKPIVLYRGLLFNSSSLKERRRYDGQLEVGDGLKFLRSIRDGTRIVDLKWDRASSWSTDKSVAMSFAKFDSAQSNFSATTQWLARGDKGNAIDGDLGFIITTLARPEDVLIDIQRMITTSHFKHGAEGEIILAPGEYTCRVSTKYTKAGEVDPVDSGKMDDGLKSAIDEVIQFAKAWKVPANLLAHDDGYYTVDVDRLFKNGDFDKVVELNSASTKEKVLELHDDMISLYKNVIAKIDKSKLETLVADEKYGKIITWINAIEKTMNENHKHIDFKGPSNIRGEVKRKDMSAKQFRETTISSISDLLKKASEGGRYTDSQVGNAVTKMAMAFDKKSKANIDLHRAAGKEQASVLDALADSFYNKVKVTKPEDRTEGLKKMVNFILAAERNAHLLSQVIQVHKDLNLLLKSAPESTGSDK